MLWGAGASKHQPPAPCKLLNQDTQLEHREGTIHETARNDAKPHTNFVIFVSCRFVWFRGQGFLPVPIVSI